MRMKECISLKYLGNSSGRAGMGGVIAVQEYFQVSVLAIWVDGGTITKPGTAGCRWGRVF